MALFPIATGNTKSKFMTFGSLQVKLSHGNGKSNDDDDADDNDDGSNIILQLMKGFILEGLQKRK